MALGGVELSVDLLPGDPRPNGEELYMVDVDRELGVVGLDFILLTLARSFCYILRVSPV